MTVQIEVMIDTNVHSREMSAATKSFHELAEFRDYMRIAGEVTGEEYNIVQRDTAQIFHEKTNLLTPELAAQAGIPILPAFIAASLHRVGPDGKEEGFYYVEPPIHGEAEYYVLLRETVFKMQQRKDASVLKQKGITKPEDIDDLTLQQMFRDHIPGLPGDSPIRQEPWFKHYAKNRFNYGEVTAANYVREHPLPDEGDRKAIVFVSADRGAKRNMAKARAGKNDKGRLKVDIVSAKSFRQFMEEVIREVEKEHPEMKAVRAGYSELNVIDGDKVPNSLKGATSNIRGRVQPALPKAPVPSPNLSDSERATQFADFVLRSKTNKKHDIQER